MFSPLMLSRCPASQKSFTWTDKATLRTIPVYLAKKKAPTRAFGAHFATNRNGENCIGEFCQCAQ
jgi:hypothetical protein